MINWWLGILEMFVTVKSTSWGEDLYAALLKKQDDHAQRL